MPLHSVSVVPNPDIPSLHSQKSVSSPVFWRNLSYKSKTNMSCNQSSFDSNTHRGHISHIMTSRKLCRPLKTILICLYNNKNNNTVHFMLKHYQPVSWHLTCNADKLQSQHFFRPREELTLKTTFSEIQVSLWLRLRSCANHPKAGILWAGKGRLLIYSNRYIRDLFL